MNFKAKPIKEIYKRPYFNECKQIPKNFSYL